MGLKETFKKVTYAFFLVSLTLATGCLSSGGEEASSETENPSENPAPGDTPENPTEPSPIVQESSFWHRDLVQFLLRQTDFSDCERQQVKLVAADGTEFYFNTVQEAVEASVPGARILVGPGKFHELVNIEDKNQLTIESGCSPEIRGFDLVKSADIRIKGFRINAKGTGRSGITLHGFKREEANARIQIELNEIYGADEQHGIVAGRYNTDIQILKNFIHSAELDGLNFDKSDDSESLVKDNVIAHNQRNGVRIDKKKKLVLENNLIIDNGRSLLSLERFGVYREKGWFKKHGSPENVTLTGNTITSNNGISLFDPKARDIGNPEGILDGADSGNLTTSGLEGAGVAKLQDAEYPNIQVGVENGAIVRDPTLVVPILVQDRSAVEISVQQNSQEISFTEDFFTNLNVSLKEGMNNFVIRAKDVNGNEGYITFGLKLDPDAPEIVVPTARCNPGEVYTKDESGGELIFSSIQAAIDQAGTNWTVFVGFGVFNEILQIDGKSRLDIKTLCNAQIRGVEVVSSEYVKVDGFVIDASGTGKPGIRLHGDRNFFSRGRPSWGKWFRSPDQDNENIAIVNNEIRKSDSGDHGILVDRGNTNTYIFNNFIHENGRTGIYLEDLVGGPHLIEKNTIAKNRYNGVEIGIGQIVTLKDNIIIENGTASGSNGGRYGVNVHRGLGFLKTRAEHVTLIGNTIANNNGHAQNNRSSRDIANYDDILDETDGPNYTTDGSESPTFIRLQDVTPPAITLGASGGFMTPSPLFTLPIAVSDTSPVNTEIVLNGGVVFASPLFQFQKALTLQEGNNQVEVRATDAAGNTTTAVLENIILDTIPPVLSDFIPADGETVYTNAESIFVGGKANEKIRKVTVNDALLTILADEMEFSGVIFTPITMPLTLRFAAEDLVGNKTEQSIGIQVVVDKVAPVVALTGEQNKITNQSNYSFSYSVTEENLDKVRIFRNGSLLQELPTLTSTLNVVLQEGRNDFEVIAIDLAGNISEVARLQNITLDTVAPQITITKPQFNDLITTFNFAVTGSSNEALQSIRAAGQSLTLSGLNFSGTIAAPKEGALDLLIEAVDLAGNATNIIVPVQVSLRLLNIALVTAEPSPNAGLVNVVGGIGASRPGARITIRRGLFDTDSTISDENGAFLIETDLFSQVTVTSKDLSTGETESGNLTFNLETKLSGVIRDIDNEALPQVTVRILGTSINVKTNGSGVFLFNNPPTGIQTLELDASTVPASIVGDDRKFSKIQIKVNVGVGQQNVLERPIYFPALLLDGTETNIINGSAATVTSPHAPGVVLQVPANRATFPNGTKTGAINISIVDAAVSTMPVLEAAVPESVISLEPSGLEFSQPVQLTVPNDNDLPEGTDMVILSLNSKSGQWEVDGVATVDPGGQTITTKSGQGITHFSEIYAVPINPELRNLGDSGQPGIDVFSGSLSRELTLPSFKSLGGDVAPKLIYRSAWANPTATVNHFIDIPPQKLELTRNESGKGLEICSIIGVNECIKDYNEYWKYVKFQFNSVFKTAYQPQSITGKLFVGDLQAEIPIPASDPSIPFDSVPAGVDIEEIQGLPNQSVISYAVELKNKQTGQFLPSGLYPTLGRYEIKLKKLTIKSTRLSADFERSVKTIFGRQRVRDHRVLIDDPPTVESQILDQALLHDVGAELVVKNQVNSEAGRGWAIAGVQKIINPNSNSVVIDEGNGSTSIYRLDDRISTVWRNTNSNIEIQNGVDFSSLPVIYMPAKNLNSKRVFVASANTSSTSSGFSNLSEVVYNIAHFKNSNFEKCINMPVERTGPFGIFIEFLPNPFRLQKFEIRSPINISGISSVGGGQFVLVDEGSHRILETDGGSTTASRQKTENLPEPSAFGTGGTFLSTSTARSICNQNFGECELVSDVTKECDSAHSPRFVDDSDTNFYRQLDDLLFSEGILRHPIVDVWRDHPARGPSPESFGLVRSKTIFTSPFAGVDTGPGTFAANRKTGVNDGVITVPSTSSVNAPGDAVFDPVTGRVIVVDTGNNRILRFNRNNNSVQLVAGNGQTNGGGDGGAATNASVVRPASVAFDSDGTMYVTTTNKIRRIDTSGIITTYAGLATGVDNAASEIHVSQLALNKPSGMVIDKVRGFLYVADTGNNRIIRIDLDSNKAVTVAGGQCNQSQLRDGGPALDASLCAPNRLGLDTAGNLYIWDSQHQAVRKVIFDNANGAFFGPTARDGSKLEKNSNGTWTRTYRNGSQVRYDINGKQTSATDRVGRQTTFQYDSQGRLLKIKDPTGQEVQYNYSGSKLVSIVDPSGRQTTFTYSGNQLAEARFPDNTKKSFEYDSRGLMLKETDQRNNETEFEYTAFHRLKKTTQANGAVVSGDDLESKATGNGASAGNPAQLASLGMESNDLYDGIKDPRNVETKFVRDIFGYVTTFEDGEGRKFEIQRDEMGKPLKIVRPDGSFSEFIYNPTTHDLLERRDSTGITIVNQYNQFGQMTRTIGEDQVEIKAQYDGTTGLLLSRQVANQTKEINQYNSLGLIAQKLLPIGGQNIIVNFEYDNLGNLTRRLVSSGEETLFEYDASGNVVKKIEKVNGATTKVTQYTYDLFNRLTSVKLPDNTLTSYSYLPTGELSEVMDAEGNKISFIYDAIGQLLQKIDQNGKITRRFYDPNGNVIRTVDAKGGEVLFEYDNLDRVKKKTLPDNIFLFGYDVRGNVTAVSNNVSSISNIYDNRDRLTSTTVSGLGALAAYPATTLDYDYSLAGNLISMSDSLGGSTSYGYDAQNRLTSLTNHKSETFGFSYDQNDRLERITRPGGETLFTLNDSSFITSIVHKSGGVTRAIASYQRNDLGFATQLTTLSGTHNYSYDANSQLTSASHPGASHPDLANENFSYDSIGNRISDHTGSYLFSANKQLIEEDPRYFYMHDDNGNMLQKRDKVSGTITNYEYTSENQLKRVYVTAPNLGPIQKEVIYHYDALGRRMQKRFVDHQDSTKSFTRKYVYDGNEILAEFNGSNQVLARYTHSRLRTDDVLAADITSSGVSAGLAASAGSYFYLKDALGTITDVLNVSGQLVQKYSYAVYGQIVNVQDGSGADITSSPALTTSYTFTGREWDAEMGMYYYRARYYDPATGRFLQRDPKPGRVELPISVVNRNAYAYNNPAAFVDPKGEFGFLAFLAVSTIVGGLIGGIDAALSGGDFWKGFGKGAFAGFALGLTFGISPAAGFLTLGSNLLRAGAGRGSFVGNFIDASVENNIIDTAISGFQGDFSNFFPDLINDFVPYIGGALLFSDVAGRACDNESGVLRGDRGFICEVF